MKEAVTIGKRLTRQQDRALTREQLLRSASVLFAGQGASGTSIAQRAESPGSARRAFYGDFDSEHELVLAPLKQRTQREFEEVRAMNRHAGTFGQTLGTPRSWHRRHDKNLACRLTLRTELRLHGSLDRKLPPVPADRERRSRARVVSLYAGMVGLARVLWAPRRRRTRRDPHQDVCTHLQRSLYWTAGDLVPVTGLLFRRPHHRVRPPYTA
ncbi:hypothetical protein [Streptomyces sp. NPDC006510]|uniref:TetR/AcrR family transcriptional regulator n=1 Tax=Streptomyces sp. NPDC006510 TaxID=3155600 RepID=UPI0033A689CD